MKPVILERVVAGRKLRHRRVGEVAEADWTPRPERVEEADWEAALHPRNRKGQFRRKWGAEIARPLFPAGWSGDAESIHKTARQWTKARASEIEAEFRHYGPNNGVRVEHVHFDADLSPGSGQYDIDTETITLSQDTRRLLAVVEKQQQAGQPLSKTQAEYGWGALEVFQHEITHAVNPTDNHDYADKPAGKVLEEGLNEEAARLMTVRWAKKLGLTDILSWEKEALDADPERQGFLRSKALGGYSAYRNRIRAVIEETDIPEAEWPDLVLRMKFQMGTNERRDVLAKALRKAGALPPNKRWRNTADLLDDLAPGEATTVAYEDDRLIGGGEFRHVRGIPESHQIEARRNDEGKIELREPEGAGGVWREVLPRPYGEKGKESTRPDRLDRTPLMRAPLESENYSEGEWAARYLFEGHDQYGDEVFLDRSEVAARLEEENSELDRGAFKPLIDLGAELEDVPTRTWDRTQLPDGSEVEAGTPVEYRHGGRWRDDGVFAMETGPSGELFLVQRSDGKRQVVAPEQVRAKAAADMTGERIRVGDEVVVREDYGHPVKVTAIAWSPDGERAEVTVEDDLGPRHFMPEVLRLQKSRDPQAKFIPGDWVTAGESDEGTNYYDDEGNRTYRGRVLAISDTDVVVEDAFHPGQTERFPFYEVERIPSKPYGAKLSEADFEPRLHPRDRRGRFRRTFTALHLPQTLWPGGWSKDSPTQRKTAATWAQNRAAEVAKQYGGPAKVRQVTFDSAKPDLSSNYVPMDERVNMGRDFLPIMEALERVHKKDRHLSMELAKHTWRATKTFQHEIDHGVNPMGREYGKPGGRELEEALNEEASRLLAVRWLKQRGEVEPLAWLKEGLSPYATWRDKDDANGSYRGYREALRKILEEARVPREEWPQVVMDLKFQTKTTAERLDILGEMLRRGGALPREDPRWRNTAEDVDRLQPGQELKLGEFPLYTATPRRHIKGGYEAKARRNSEFGNIELFFAFGSGPPIWYTVAAAGERAETSRYQSRKRLSPDLSEGERAAAVLYDAATEEDFHRKARREYVIGLLEPSGGSEGFAGEPFEPIIDLRPELEDIQSRPWATDVASDGTTLEYGTPVEFKDENGKWKTGVVTDLWAGEVGVKPKGKEETHVDHSEVRVKPARDVRGDLIRVGTIVESIDGVQHGEVTEVIWPPGGTEPELQIGGNWYVKAKHMMVPRPSKSKPKSKYQWETGDFVRVEGYPGRVLAVGPTWVEIDFISRHPKVQTIDYDAVKPLRRGQGRLREATDFRERLHPRDRKGRFRHKLGIPAVLAPAPGQVGDRYPPGFIRGSKGEKAAMRRHQPPEFWGEQRWPFPFNVVATEWGEHRAFDLSAQYGYVPFDLKAVYLESEERGMGGFYRPDDSTIHLSQNVRPALEAAERAKQEHRPLSQTEAEWVFLANDVFEHEIGHSVNPASPKVYGMIPGGRVLEEALNEETTRALTVQWLRQRGETEPLSWLKDALEGRLRTGGDFANLFTKGTYQTYRARLKKAFRDAGIPEDEWEHTLLRMKFEMNGHQRLAFLGKRLRERGKFRREKFTEGDLVGDNPWREMADAVEGMPVGETRHFRFPRPLPPNPPLFGSTPRDAEVVIQKEPQYDETGEMETGYKLMVEIDKESGWPGHWEEVSSSEGRPGMSEGERAAFHAMGHDEEFYLAEIDEREMGERLEPHFPEEEKQMVKVRKRFKPMLDPLDMLQDIPNGDWKKVKLGDGSEAEVGSKVLVPGQPPSGRAAEGYVVGFGGDGVKVRRQGGSETVRLKASELTTAPVGGAISFGEHDNIAIGVEVETLDGYSFGKVKQIKWWPGYHDATVVTETWDGQQLEKPASELMPSHMEEGFDPAEHPRDRRGRFRKKLTTAGLAQIIKQLEPPPREPSTPIDEDIATAITDAASAKHFMEDRLGVKADIDSTADSDPVFWWEVAQAVRDVKTKFPQLETPESIVYTVADPGVRRRPFSGIKTLDSYGPEREEVIKDMFRPGHVTGGEPGADPHGFAEGVWAATGSDPQDELKGDIWITITGNINPNNSNPDLAEAKRTGLAAMLGGNIAVADKAPYGRMTHELGHAVLRASGLAGGEVLSRSGRKPKGDTSIPPWLSEKHLGGMLEEAGVTPRDVAEISGYGARNIQEAWAEIFAMLHAGFADQIPPSLEKKIAKLVEVANVWAADHDVPGGKLL